MRFICDACSGSSRSARPITLAVGFPEYGPSARMAISTAGCALPPTAHPMKFTIARRASWRTSSGMSAIRPVTTYEARVCVSAILPSSEIDLDAEIDDARRQDDRWHLPRRSENLVVRVERVGGVRVEQIENVHRRSDGLVAGLECLAQPNVGLIDARHVQRAGRNQVHRRRRAREGPAERETGRRAGQWVLGVDLCSGEALKCRGGIDPPRGR